MDVKYMILSHLPLRDLARAGGYDDKNFEIAFFGVSALADW